jgi:two-component system LytT family sensor kinase
MSETMIPAVEPAGTEDGESARIRKRVHQKADFYRHVVVYVVVGAILAAIDLLTSPQSLWFYWPMGFWAIGLVLNFLDVYVMGEGAGLEKRMLEREMRRHHSPGR